MASPNQRLSLDTNLDESHSHSLPGRRVSPPSSPRQSQSPIGINNPSTSLGSSQSGMNPDRDTQLEADLDSARQMSVAVGGRERTTSLSNHHHHHHHHSHSHSHSLLSHSHNHNHQLHSHSPQLERGNPVLTTTNPSPSRPYDGNQDSNDYHYGTSPTRRNQSTGGNPTTSSSISPGAAGSLGRTGGASGSAMNQAALARFYQQRHARHGSNTSLDSAQHFIDHRQQPHSVGGIGPHSPSAFRANTNPMSTSPRQHQSSSNGGERGATLPPPLMRSPSSFQRNMPTSADLQGSALNTDEEPNSRSDPISSSNREEEEEEGRRTPHTMSRRPSMLEDDVCFPMNSGGENDEGLDGRMHSMEEDYMHHHYHHEGHHEMEHLPQDLPPGYPFTFDLQALEDFASEERERSNGINGPSSAAPGLRNRHSYGPNSTSMTFDSTGRKDSTGRSTAMAGNENASGINNFSAYGVSPDSDDAQFYSRRPRKFSHSAAARKAADSGAPGGSSRYQRKLALFEGAGTSPPPPVGSAARGNIMGTGALLDAERREVQSKGNLVDASTPLLGDKDINGNGGGGLPSYDGTTTTSRSMPGGGNGMGFGGGDLEDETPIKASSRPPRSYSQGAFSAGGRARPPHQGMGNNSGPNYGFGFTHQVQPYRFTFYSNALPSTIHARNLAELPAPGQTFEELFSGRSPSTRSTNTPAPNDQTTLAPEDEVKRNPAENSSPSTSRPVSRVNTIASGKGSNPTSGTVNLAAALRSVSAGSTMAPPPGRVEGTTAPPTGANTPVLGQDFSNSPFISQLPKANAALTGVNVKAATHANAQQHGLTPVTAAAFQQQQQQQAQAAAAAAGSGGPGDMRSHPNGRSLPGGGIRMDQGPEANTWWLDVLSPTDQEMKLLSRVFGIHPLTTEDILMEETREKIELFRNYYLVCFRSFDQDPYSPTYLEPLNMYIIVFREGTLSFHFRNTPHPQNVRRRIKQLKDYINVTSDWISYALIDDITDAFGPLIQGIEYEVDSIDELVLILKDAEQSDMLRRIGTCRKKVMGLLRLMGNKADVVKGLSKRCNENWSVAPKSDIGLYLSDIQDHLITMTQNLNHYEKILSRSHSNYLAQISIEMTDANNQINDVLSKLTALGTIIVPMNVITGLWGMNVNVPGQGVENLRWFGSIVAVMVAFAIIGYIMTIRYLQR